MRVGSFPADDLVAFHCPRRAYEHIEATYRAAVKSLYDAFKAGVVGASTRAVYPYIALEVEHEHLVNENSWSYGFVSEPGRYGITVTCPTLFKEYLIEQMGLLMKRHRVPLYVGRSRSPIPLPFALTSFEGAADIASWRNDFDWPDLCRISDEIPNGVNDESSIKPLALFEAERVDYSLHRLQHYTGTNPSHFQKFILFTNYQLYIEAFVNYGKRNVGGFYQDIIGPGNVSLRKQRRMSQASLPQMPAYHLVREDGLGITCINIGVGPSNAKTMSDHVAVLRPHCWIMLGHCAGLRSTQTLGDYVMAHGYVREDNVLNQDLPPWIPLPPIAEVQVALQEAVESVLDDPRVKERMRTGTVVTTDNRNWELRSRELYERFRQSRAIAVDMESATLAGNGFRFRVPYGTLLCVSDKPIQGEIKLQGVANIFYRDSILQHLEVGLEAVHLLRERGVSLLHSRKLRGFDEPPFR